MMKKWFFLPLILLSLSVQAGHFEYGWNMFPLTSADAGKILRNDNLYYFTGDSLIIKNDVPFGCGLNVLAYSTAYLYIAEGQYMEIHGGDGQWITPGGAGINVPESSTLYILGGGKLVVYGGDAGQGNKGMLGLPGIFFTSKNKVIPGIGGFGGSGGGGAGAGIGTRGSMGGLGGFIALKAPVPMDTIFDGAPAADGWSSVDTKNCGKVYVVGTVHVEAIGGKAIPKLEESPVSKITLKYTPSCVFDWADDYVVGWGGAGGNGNTGMPGAMFGGGGVGASGAGGGAGGGVAAVHEIDVMKVLKNSALKLTQITADVILHAFNLELPGIIILHKIPLLDGQIRITVGQFATKVIDILCHSDAYPMQINGGCGEGSYKDGCVQTRVDGIGFWQGTSEFKDLNGADAKISCQVGGKMGQFGTQGHAMDLKRSWLAYTNQNMDVFTKATYPKELIEALTFDVEFDLSEISLLSDYPEDFSVVYSDTIPRHLPIPTPLELGAEFLGYSDSTGHYWYDRNGNALSTATDSLGQPLYIYLHPGDLLLSPRWSSKAYVIVRHWLEGTDYSALSGKMEYSIGDYDLDKAISGNVYTAPAKHFANYIPAKGSDTITLKAGELNILDMYYNRVISNLQWSLPNGLEIADDADDYTPAGLRRCGASITAPKYAKDKVSGIYYSLTDWHIVNDTILLTDTMPNYAAVYVPTATAIPAHLYVYNDDEQGIISSEPQYLGTDIVLNVQPAEGLELDTCYVYKQTDWGYEEEKVFQTENNKLVVYASPDIDSMVVAVRYRGIQHKLNYKESTTVRCASMTMYLNGDSVDNDAKVSYDHPVRTGDRVWLCPEPSDVSSYVCKSIRVVTASGKEIETSLMESYDEMNVYDMYYAFVMPNEDVQVESTYGLLNEELVNLRVVTDEGTAHVYSTRGRLLDSTYVFAKGYKVNAGQIVWIEIPHLQTEVPLDSIRIRYSLSGGGYSYAPINAQMFVKNMQDPALPADTTVAPKAYTRYAFRMPSYIKEALVEIHHRGSDAQWEEEDTALEELNGEAPDPRIYDIFGRCVGTDPKNLPAGVYIRKGEKYYIH